MRRPASAVLSVLLLLGVCRGTENGPVAHQPRNHDLAVVHTERSPLLKQLVARPWSERVSRDAPTGRHRLVRSTRSRRPHGQPSRVQTPDYLLWARSVVVQNLRFCESTNNYRSVSVHNGVYYYGAYQFDLETYRSIGGPGIPSEQSPAVQDLYAYRLYLRRGYQPWQCMT